MMELVLQILALIATVVGVIMLLRPYLAKGGLLHLNQLLDSVQKSMHRDGRTDDPVAVAFHDTLVDLTVYYCALCASAATPPPMVRQRGRARKSRPELESVFDYVEDNPWTWPFAAAMVFRLRIAAFIGRPWSLFHALSAVTAWAILANFRTKDGGVDLTFARSTSREKLEAAVSENFPGNICPA